MTSILLGHLLLSELVLTPSFRFFSHPMRVFGLHTVKTWLCSLVVVDRQVDRDHVTRWLVGL